MSVNPGSSDSTIAGTGSAVKVFDRFQKGREDPVLDEITEVHVEGDHLVSLLTAFGTYFRDLQIKTPLGFMTPKTKGIYYGKVKEELKKKFPLHVFWLDKDAWTSMLKNFNTGCTRQRQFDDDVNATDTKCRSIYKDNMAENGNGNLVRYCLVETSTDLRSIAHKLLSQPSAANHQKRLESNMTFSAVGRGGEHYLLRWDEAFWDPRFRLPEFTWPVIKQVAYQTMVFVPEKYHPFAFLVDIFHSFGTWFLLANGLFNGRYHPAKQKYVFPTLHNKRKEAVARDMTATIRKNLPDAIPKELVNCFSSRSLRKGASTILAAHPNVFPDERIARGGWTNSSNKNADTYVDSTFVLSMPGGMALAGFRHCHREVFPPRTAWLGLEAGVIEALIEEMYLIDVPEFLGGGKLRPLLDVCTASLIMYHSDFIRVFGAAHPLPAKMIQSAVRAKIRDPSCPDGTSASQILLSWSEQLRSRYDELNMERPIPSDTLEEQLNGQTLEINRLKTRISHLEMGNQTTHNKIDALATSQQASSQEQQELIGLLKGVQRMAITASSPKASSPKASSPRTASSSPKAANHPSVTPPSPIGGARLDFSTVTLIGDQPTARGEHQKSSVKAVTLSDILTEHFTSGALANVEEPSGLYSGLVPVPPALMSEKRKYLRAMKLVALCIQSEDWKTITSESADEAAAMKILHQIDKNALETMNELQLQVGVKADGDRARATVAALGERFRKWASAIGKQSQNPEEVFDSKLTTIGYKSKSRQSVVSNFFPCKPKPATKQKKATKETAASPAKRDGKKNKARRNPYAKENSPSKKRKTK